MNSKPEHTPVVLLLGPTASGKTAAALALAARFPIEIVSVDSACVYRGMDVGTAKPSRAEQAAVAHHLIDCTDPWQPYSAARFASDARAAIADIRARGKIALLVGGTMLYAKALMQGLDDLPTADPMVRARIEQRAHAQGWPALHASLAQLDPATAARLAPQDAQRISRALEIIELTGKPMSELIAKRSVASRDSWRVIALLPSQRAVLHARIERRFEQMLALGLVEEVEHLRSEPRIHAALPAMRCVGYRQCWQMLDGAIGRDDLRYRGITATRQLAKRQLTWLRSMRPDVIADCTATIEHAAAPLDLAAAFAKVCGLTSSI